MHFWPLECLSPPPVCTVVVASPVLSAVSIQQQRHLSLLNSVCSLLCGSCHAESGCISAHAARTSMVSGFYLLLPLRLIPRPSPPLRVHPGARSAQAARPRSRSRGARGRDAADGRGRHVLCSGMLGHLCAVARRPCEPASQRPQLRSQVVACCLRCQSLPPARAAPQ
eukprot:COSAG01_NODE_7998_length_2958_cov_3.415530_3_plen_168_part_00